MTTATNIQTKERASSWFQWLASPIYGVVIPYAICILALAPFLLLYYTQLFRMRPHYQFFPFAILVTAVGIYLRWPRTQQHPFRNSRFSDVLFVLGCLCGLAGVVLSHAWTTALGAYLFVTSFLARTKDGETGRSMLPLSLPLWITLALPSNYDVTLITWLQVFSAKAASHVLDLLGLHHHLAGTILRFPERDYGVAEACSGVQSFFTLLFLTAVFVVFTHRPWFRGLLLLISALFWAILMNSVRIVLIPLAQTTLGWDLASPFNHAVLGYVVLFVAALLVMSTDQFLTFIFGPVETTTLDSTSDSMGAIARFWNRVIAGKQEGTLRVKSKVISKSTRRMIACGAALMLFLGLLSTGTAFQMLRDGYVVRFFQGLQPLAMAQEDLPAEFKNWRWIEASESETPFVTTEREAASDFGMRSDQWIYDSGTYRVAFSFDQPFPGWHELTHCYKNIGWNLVPEGRIHKDVLDKNNENWPYIQCQFTRPTGEKAYLLFSLFDVAGEPFQAPADWGAINSFFIRLRNRLSPEVRKRLFNSESYQVQAFVYSARALTDEERQSIQDNYLGLREIIRESFLRRQALREKTGDQPKATGDEKK